MHTTLRRLNAAMSPAAMLVAILALVVAGAGVGYAAATIGTSDIKNGAVTAKKIKNGAVTGKKIRSDAVTSAKIKNGSVGRADLAPGADKLLQGAPWATLPSGVTVTGHFYDHSTSSPDDSLIFNFDLPGYAPLPLADNAVNFAPDASAGTTDDAAACTGSYTSPTAPAGKLCFYLDSFSGIASMAGYTWDSTAHRNQAFYIEGDVQAGNAYSIWGVWAYTAP